MNMDNKIKERKYRIGEMFKSKCTLDTCRVVLEIVTRLLFRVVCLLLSLEFHRSDTDVMIIATSS